MIMYGWLWSRTAAKVEDVSSIPSRGETLFQFILSWRKRYNNYNFIY